MKVQRELNGWDGLNGGHITVSNYTWKYETKFVGFSGERKEAEKGLLDGWKEEGVKWENQELLERQERGEGREQKVMHLSFVFTGSNEEEEKKRK